MTLRVCRQPGCGLLTDRGLCREHRRTLEQQRGSATRRGYGSRHARAAKAWQRKVAAGELVTCWRCGQPITDPSDVHLGHDDQDRSITRGPEHGRACNLAAAGRKRHATN